MFEKWAVLFLAPKYQKCITSPMMMRDDLDDDGGCADDDDDDDDAGGLRIEY